MSSTQKRNLVDSRFILRPVSSDNYRLHQGVWNKITWATYLYITFVRDIIWGPTVLAKAVGLKIHEAQNMSHLPEIYRLFPGRITAELLISICISVGVFLRNVNSSMSLVYIQAFRVVLLNSLTKCALVTRNA